MTNTVNHGLKNLFIEVYLKFGIDAWQGILHPLYLKKTIKAGIYG